MRFLVFIIFCYGFYIIEANAKDYSGFGEYRFGPNVAESTACKLAFERAKINALSKVFGEKIFAEDVMRCSEMDNAECELNKSIIITIDGTINEIKNRERTLAKLEGHSICSFQIIANIDKPKQARDPKFDFNIKINKKYFRDGENLTIQIEPTIKMFVNIFQWEPYQSAGIKLIKIFPNKFESNNEIKNKKLIPEGYNFKVEYPTVQDKKYVDEYLVVLATKEKITFLTEYEFKNFQVIISEIPNNEYRLKKRSYEILKN